MPALLVALCCAAGLVALGDLRTEPWSAIVLMVAWGGLVLGVHALDLRRLTHGQPIPTLDPDPHAPSPRQLWRLDVRRLSPWTVLLAAMAVRAVLLASPPTLSDDVYRYAWEGWLSLQGGNPYAVPPAGDHGGLDHPLRLLVNHPDVSTIYPPLAMALFSALAAIAPHVLTFKVAMGLADAGIAACLAGALRARGQSTSGAWLYAMLPLGAVESAGSGHMEVLGVLCLTAALWSWSVSGSRGAVGWAALGALFKLMPALILPTLLRGRLRSGLVELAVVAVLGLAALLPFIDAGPTLLAGFGAYAQHWSFNASGFALLSALLPLPPAAVRGIAVAIGGVVVVLAAWRLRDPARVAMWAGGAFVLLSPTVHPWYLLWVWVPALLCGVRAWTVLAVLAPLSYAALASYNPSTGSWEEPAWPVWVQYLPLAVALTAEWLSHWIRPGPWRPRSVPGGSVATSSSASPT